jgi:hypothetical protein
MVSIASQDKGWYITVSKDIINIQNWALTTNLGGAEIPPSATPDKPP